MVDQMDSQDKHGKREGAARNADSDVPKGADSRIDRRPSAEEWMYIWGEVIQLRRAGHDGVVRLEEEPGSRRGGYSLPNCLLIHAEVDRALRRTRGDYGVAMAAKLYVDGWEWIEEQKEQDWADGTKTYTPTGRYVRSLKAGIGSWDLRRIREIVLDVAGVLELRA